MSDPVEHDRVVETRQNLGGQLVHYREAVGLTQEQLAERIGVHRTTVTYAERGRRHTSRELWERADRALAAGGQLVCGYDHYRAARSAAHRQAARGLAHDAQVAGEDELHAGISRLRRVLNRIDLPDDGPIRSMAELRAAVARMNEYRVQARYGELAWHLPGLIEEVA